MHIVVFTLRHHVYVSPAVVHDSFQAGGFKLPFIVMGGLLLFILPVVSVMLPSDESKFIFT